MFVFFLVVAASSHIILFIFRFFCDVITIFFFALARFRLCRNNVCAFDRLNSFYLFSFFKTLLFGCGLVPIQIGFSTDKSKKRILRFIACKKRNKQTFTFQDRMTNGLFVAHRFAIRLINIFFPSLRLLELSLSLLLYNGSPCHWQFFFSSSQLADRKPVILHLNS